MSTQLIKPANDITPANKANPEQSTIQWALWAERYGLVGAWLLLIIIFGSLNPAIYLSWFNFSTMLSSQAVLVILTLGLIIPLTAGDLDMSIASTMTISSMIVAVLNIQHHWPVLLAILAAIVAGVVIGLVNSFFVLYFRIHSLIVTLGTGYFLQGVVLWISQSQVVYGVSDNLTNWVVIYRLFGISLSFYYALALCILLWFYFEYTSYGRRLLFVGRGREVARLSGIQVDRVRMYSLVAASAIAALAGVVYTGYTGSADPTSGLSYILPAYAAAFLGATSIIPGRFNAWGTILSVYFLVSGITGLTMLGLPTLVQNLFYGGGLLLAVALSQLIRGREPQEFS